MDFLGFLRDLFGGGQKPAAPPAQQSRPNPRQADYQDAKPVARDPFRSSAPAPAANPFQQSAPAFTPLPAPWRPPAAFVSAPAPAQAAPMPAPTTGIWRQMPPEQMQESLSFNRGKVDGTKYGEQRKAKEAESAYFGDQDEYAPEEMSVDAYLSLAPMQRAAVDANTALVQAAEEDIASWAKQQVAGTPVNDQNYFSKVREKFGDEGGSDTYAPRTMAVLEDLGLNLQGKDLDQYLNHSALVTDADLKMLLPGANVPTAGLAPADPRQQNAVSFAEAASNRLSETLAVGQTLLDSLRTGSDTGRQLFGAPATTAPVGFTPNERDEDLRKAFDVLSQTRSQQDLTPETLSGLYAELETKHGVTPNEVAQYFETRLQSNEYLNAAEDSDVTLGGPTSSLEYLAPQDFRAKFLKRGE